MKAQNTIVHNAPSWAGWLCMLCLSVLIGCNNESRGFVLPEGDAEIGKQLFVELSCTRCHSIAQIEWTGQEEKNDPHIRLGGEVSSMKTYGELVTSVINPSHRISRHHLPMSKVTMGEGASKMELYRYNEIMTVEELVNLVTFLQSEYELMTPEYPIPYARY